MSQRRVCNHRGGAALEAALLLPVLVTLVFGIIDVGDALAHRTAASSSSRIAAIAAFDAGEARSADLEVLEAAVTELSNRGLEDIRRVIVYNAATATSPPAACLAVNPSGMGGGVAGLCNVYGTGVVTLVRDGNADASFDSENCAGDVDAYWCPAVRASAAGWRVGIFVEARRNAPTGVVPQLRTYTLKENVVVEVWPQEPTP